MKTSPFSHISSHMSSKSNKRSIFGFNYRRIPLQMKSGMFKSNTTKNAEIMVSTVKIPEYLREFYEFQTLLLSKDMIDESNIEFVKDFFYSKTKISCSST